MKKKDSIEIKAYFDDIADQIEKELHQAKESICICVAWIDWRKFTPIFNKLTKKGIKIEVIYNKDAINEKNFIEPSENTKIFAIEAGYRRYMHNKFCIIDKKTIITGSFNWSKQAKYHHENVVIIKNNFELVASYLNEFYNIKDHFYYKDIAPEICEFEYKDKITNKVKKCRYHTYRLGIVGNEEGIYGNSMLTIWKICKNNPEHGQKLSIDYHNFPLTNSRIYKEQYLDYDEIHDSKEKIKEMLSQRKSLEILREYFQDSKNNRQIQAIGRVIPTNEMAYIESFAEKMEYIIQIIWKEMYFRKSIPNKIYDDGYFISNEIINEYI
ncbi:phospholipase D-like domain-containing protein [Acinetobacter baumannii]|uniref:phospholipase D-like domain-containing protein n=1 Tax=Acinetobacter baumannii TaxID=470 RepID=UPI003CFC1164